SYDENFGLAAAEALACGVPVVVSDRVGLAEEIQDAGAGWVTPLDPLAFRSALRQAMADAEERAHRGARARELARTRYSWATVAEELLTLYRSVVDGPRQASADL